MEADELVIDVVDETPTDFLEHMIQLDADLNISQFQSSFKDWIESPGSDADTLQTLADAVSNLSLEIIFDCIDCSDTHLHSHAFDLARRFGHRLLGTTNSLSKLRSFMSLFLHSDDLRDMIRDYFDVIYCVSCDEYEYADETQEVYNGDDVCRDCIANNYISSDYEDAYIYYEDSRTAIDGNGREVTIHVNNDDFAWSDYLRLYVHYHHPNHPDNHNQEPELIGNYHSSKNSFLTQLDDWSMKHRRYFGVELEVVHVDGNTHEAAEVIHNEVNDIGDGPNLGQNMFFERDGSLGNSGFEMITQPMSLPAQRELWKFLQDKSLVRGLRSHKTGNCGLHVHVSRTGLTKLQIAKLVTFVNNPLHEDFIRAIARRYQNGYCNIKPKKIGSAAQSNDRYEAVNLTPRNTIEFRLFKGTLKYESLIAAIEFCHALIEFCKPTQTSIADLTTDAFMRFMEEKIPHETEFVRPYIKNNLESE